MAPSSYYRPPTKQPVSRWARHIDAWMRREGLSQTGAFRRLRAAFGLGEESRSAFLPYLVNKPLDDAQQRAVAAIIGWPPEVEETKKEPEGDTLGLVKALTEALLLQAQALTDIRLELAEAARTAAAERAATGDVLARLEAQLEQLQASVDTGAGTGDRDLRRN